MAGERDVRWNDASMVSQEPPNVARFQLQDAPGSSAGLSSAAIRPFGPLP